MLSKAYYFSWKLPRKRRALTPGAEQKGSGFAFASSVKHKHDVHEHLHAFSEHQEERGQEEIVQKHGSRFAPALNYTSHQRYQHSSGNRQIS